jgi:uncharacterized protein YqjF (DUF2071 family)
MYLPIPSMFSFLKNHPFAVEAFFESSLVLTFAVPREQLRHLIPSCLQLDTFESKWAFIAVAMVQTKDLRPKGFPRIFGNDFFLIGYRLFVRYETTNGKNLRGLYILRSETNKYKMEILGNLFTHYQYSTTDIQTEQQGPITKIISQKSGFNVQFAADGTEDTRLPEGSPFTDWKEARRFAGPLPFTFSCNAAAKQVLIIEGVRENWIPQPVEVTDHRFSFIDNFKFEGAQLANAFIIRNIPYYWKKGKIEQWK